MTRVVIVTNAREPELTVASVRRFLALCDEDSMPDDAVITVRPAGRWRLLLDPRPVIELIANSSRRAPEQPDDDEDGAT